MKCRKPKLRKLDWSGVDVSRPTLMLARVTAVSISYEHGAVTFAEVRDALAREGLQAPSAAEIFKPTMFEPVGVEGGKAAWRAI